MTKQEKISAFSRRSVLLGGGALVVSMGAPIGFDTVVGINAAFAQGAKPPLTPDQLSSYIAVNADGTVAAYFGKMDMGHGLFVAIGQIVAEELDVPFKSVTVLMCPVRPNGRFSIIDAPFLSALARLSEKGSIELL